MFPLSICEIDFYRRPDSELGKLTGANASHSLQHITTDPIRSSIAFFIADVMKQCLKVDQSDPALFEFLEKRIKQLNEQTEIGAFVLDFLLHFTKHLGIEPSLDNDNKQFFYLEDGEFSDNVKKGELIAEGSAVMLIQDVLRHENNATSDKSTRLKALQITIDYYKLHIPLFNVDRSLEIIREVIYN